MLWKDPIMVTHGPQCFLYLFRLSLSKGSVILDRWLYGQPYCISLWWHGACSKNVHIGYLSWYSMCCMKDLASGGWIWACSSQRWNPTVNWLIVCWWMSRRLPCCVWRIWSGESALRERGSSTLKYLQILTSYSLSISHCYMKVGVDVQVCPQAKKKISELVIWFSNSTNLNIWIRWSYW